MSAPANRYKSPSEEIIPIASKDDPALFARVQEQNLLRQYDLLSKCIEIGAVVGFVFVDQLLRTDALFFGGEHDGRRSPAQFPSHPVASQHDNPLPTTVLRPAFAAAYSPGVEEAG